MAEQNAERLNREREKYKSAISVALDEDEDPLAAYERFVQWIIKNYGTDDPLSSGLLDVLEETTRQFKDDDGYKGNRRYLDLWAMYANLVEDSATVYAFLVEKGIGTSYCLLYEEYAKVLERDGLYSEAERIYRLGIERRARPVDKLKKLYQEFLERQQSSSTLPPPTGSSGKSAKKPKSFSQNPSKPDSSSKSSTSSLKQSAHTAAAGTAGVDGYTRLKGPLVAGKRRETLRMNLSLLVTSDGVEYSGPEARARSLGLLGKKWAPLSLPPYYTSPPPPIPTQDPVPTSIPSGSTVRINFNERTKLTGRLPVKSTMAGEPTVTINTKEALADVFGMFNSPEKTTRSAYVPGSKHAPVKKVDPVTPALRAAVVSRTPIQPPQNEGGNLSKTPGPSFQPFVDENVNRKENPKSVSTPFRPFVDPELSNKTPFITPDPNRRALALKDIATPKAAPRGISEENAVKATTLKAVPEEFNPFSKVFTPKLSGDTSAERERDGRTPSPQNPPATKDVPTMPLLPFRVFSRPSPQVENSFIPRRGSREPEGAPASTPRAALADRTPSRPFVVPEQDDSEEHRQTSPHQNEDVDADDPQRRGSETMDEYNQDFELNDDHYRVPLGGRFGQFNVMTPITERTYELTMSTRISGTPNNQSPYLQHEHDAILTAERLAAELREEEEREQALALARMSFDAQKAGGTGQKSVAEEEHEPCSESDGESPLPALQITRDRQPVDDAEHNVSPAMVTIEEKMGSLSLVQALAVKSLFKPSNPCNPFDPPIVTTLLSVIPTDAGFHDLRDRDAKLLDILRKFANKRRKVSGNTTTSVALDLVQTYSVTLGDHLFEVGDKLGEGGFGSVFAAKQPIGKQDQEEGEDEDEDDDDNEDAAPMVALKVVKPRNIWEYHVLRRLHASLPPHLRRSVVTPNALFAFRDESLLVLELCTQGTLLDIVNRASQAGVSQQGACLDEMLVIFFTTELLRLVEGMHSVGFIHGDLKIDNCLLRLEDVPGGPAAWSNVYQRSGEGGWGHKGIKVIDFGRTIDTRLFPPGQAFIAEWEVDARDCVEMREDRPWTFQPDYFGLAGIVYCMLFGKYIEAASVVAVVAGTSSSVDTRLKIATPFKRYWQAALWSRLFDLLLNPTLIRPRGELPLCHELRAVREEMETWLETNSNRAGNTLKGLLKKIERSVL